MTDDEFSAWMDEFKPTETSRHRAERAARNGDGWERLDLVDAIAAEIDAAVKAERDRIATLVRRLMAEEWGIGDEWPDAVDRMIRTD